MRKVTAPNKIQRPSSSGTQPPQDSPRPRLGLRYGVNAEARVRP